MVATNMLAVPSSGDPPPRPARSVPGSAIRPLQRWLTAVACALLYFSVAAFYVARGEPNADEGFYAQASYNAMQGKLPYRDFAYTQTPMLPYLEGPVLAVAGYGVRQQRWLNASLGTATVFVAVAVWLGAGLSMPACLGLVLVWSFCPGLVYHATIGKTYALAQLLLVLAGTVLVSGLPVVRQLLLLSLGGVLAVGCRLTTAPTVVILWLGFTTAHHRQLGWWALVGCPLLLTLLLFGPFFGKPDNVVFWTWSYHQLSLVPSDKPKLLAQSLATFPAIGTLGLGCLAAAAAQRRLLQSPSTWLLLAGGVGWIASVGATGVYTDYAVPVIPLLLLGIGVFLAGRRPWRPAWLIGSCLVLGLAGLGWLLGERHTAPGYLESLDETIAYLRQNSSPTDMVLTSMPEVALESGRPPFPGLDMGKFGVTAEMDEATAARRNIITVGQLWRAIDRQEAPLVVLSNFRTWNFHWTIPSLRPLRHEQYQKWVDLLLARYDCVYISQFYIVLKRHDPANHPLPIDLNPPE